MISAGIVRMYFLPERHSAHFARKMQRFLERYWTVYQAKVNASVIFLAVTGAKPHCHSGARAKLANPESSGTLFPCIWIPGPALRAVPE
jgi:hypothetical protein